MLEELLKTIKEIQKDAAHIIILLATVRAEIESQINKREENND